MKREIAKAMVQSLLAGKVSVDTLNTINEEVDDSPYTTSDPDIIIQASAAGLVGNETASLALGFNPGEHLAAEKDHAERLARIALAKE